MILTRIVAWEVCRGHMGDRFSVEADNLQCKIR